MISTETKNNHFYFVVGFEICLYDRAGHGFSSHLPKGSDYAYGSHLRDLRTVTQTLGWNKEKYSFIAHSYGAHLTMAVNFSFLPVYMFFYFIVCSSLSRGGFMPCRS